MASVTSLASHLLSLLQPAAGETIPKVDAARLAFYHFLKNLCDAGEPLSTAVLDRFFRRSLGHSHWAENKDELFAEVSACLQHFSNQHSEPIPLPPFSSPSDLQVLKAESHRTLEKVVDEWIQHHQGPTDQVRMLKIASSGPNAGASDDKLLVCRLGADRSLSVHIFDRMLCIRDGRLEPLSDDMAVYYNPDLTLDANRPSQIETAPHTVARFRVVPGQGFRGVQVRGYTYQKVGAFDGGELHRHPMLFYPLKRIEQFFVNRSTDPMYVELTNLLEQASDLLARKHPERVRFAEAAVERGRLAFDQVFIDDRLLRLLIENLERALRIERHELGETSVSSSQNSQTVELSEQVGNKLGLNLTAGHEFIEPYGPDLVELQEAEKCETIAPLNLERSPAP